MRNEDNGVSDQSGSPDDFDFRHHIYDTLILLGAPKKIADLLKKSQDGLITEADVDALRNYNISLFEESKRRLANLNRLVIAPAENRSQ